MHPDFDAERLHGNLALIKVQNHITFIPTVVEAATISIIEPVENDVVLAVGWENIDESVSKLEFCIFIDPVAVCETFIFDCFFFRMIQIDQKC